VPRKASEVGACKDLEGHIFTIGSGNKGKDGDMLRTSMEKIVRSSIMSHITFKMCQFVLIIYLRDYQYDFYLDIVVLWSCYGVL
jgi:hypothetical protein